MPPKSWEIRKFGGTILNSRSRLITVIDAASGATGQGYDNRDNLTSVTDPRGLVTSYVYDGFGNVIQMTSPDTGVTVYEVDLAGNRTKQTDARGVVANFAGAPFAVAAIRCYRQFVRPAAAISRVFEGVFRLFGYSELTSAAARSSANRQAAVHRSGAGLPRFSAADVRRICAPSASARPRKK